MYTIVCLMIVFLVSFIRSVPVWLYAGILLVALLFFIYGSASIQSGFYLRVLCAAKTHKRVVAISFDDGPHHDITPAVLDVLMQNDVKAVFFCIGKKISANSDTVKRMHAEGHIIGNHSYSHHHFFDLFSLKKMQHEMKQTDDLLFRTIGEKPKLFRPPYGVTNPTIARLVNLLGYTAIGWRLKSRDTVIKDEKVLSERLRKKLRPGDIILFHDTGIHVVNVLRDFISYAKENNYDIVRVDHLLNIKAYA